MLYIKRYLTSDCISFTFVVLIYSILASLDIMPPLTTLLAFQLFAMSTTATLLMAITDRIAWKNRWLSIAVDLIDVLLGVFVSGMLLNVFVLNPLNLAVVVGMCIFVYFAVYGVLMIKDQVDASRINQQLQWLQQNRDKRTGENQ
ncbi:hypothetical protein J41TS12_45230 [Paenibacillus antibioticophila]|uniref:DUF3021 domain-containing protein n=1 Tax=Paenibacillus antibioticophila TaxID=1274374 RepID=A0A919XV23_9BACL|nr:DUF3021 family protein [Paenibacillus antibioticophila]GIO39662.1 hypothetical protein J41TS12_45230 [Paenibacillus antibioticophila]